MRDMEPKDKEKLAFRTHRGLLSATSLTLMKEVLRFVSKLDGVTIRIG